MTFAAQIKPGYKRTDLGVIPDDWDVVEAVDLDPFITSGSRGWAKYYSDRGALFMRMTNLSRRCIYPDLSDQKLVDLPQNETEGLRTSLQDGDILISITADIGIIGYVSDEIPKPAYINQHIACLRFDPSKADGRFLSYYLASHGPQRRFAEMTDVGAKSGLNLTSIGKLKILCPPIAEQRAIAAAISDVDALVASLDALIAKKRDLKQAAMQQLLTGKTRLPGFKGTWSTKRLGAIGEAIIGLTYRPTDVVSDGLLVLRSSNIQEGKLRFDDNVFVNVAVPDRLRVRQGDILICVRNGSRNLIGKCAKITEEVEGMTFGAFMAVFRTPLHPFVHHQFQSDIVKRQIHEQLGATINQITNKSLNSFAVPIPSDENEQLAIAIVLSDMDADLSALEAKREKASALKQGIMQELLTGWIRLT